jgi:hypothetical protein
MKNMIGNLFEELQEVRKDTLALIEGMEKNDLERKVGNEWSISQLLKHMALSELGSIKVVKSLIKKSDTPLPPYPEDESSVEFKSPKQPPGKLICPKVVTPPDTVSSDGLLTELSQLRESTREALKLLSTVDPTSRTMEHPFFGECNMYEWFSFLVDHERVHQRQIGEVIERLQENA